MAFCFQFLTEGGKNMRLTSMARALFNVPGASTLSWRWAGLAGSRYSIDVRKKGNIVELRQQNHLIRLQSRHIKRAHEIFRNFGVYRRVLPSVKEQDMEVTDFSDRPGAVDWQHQCLKSGVAIENHGPDIWLRKGDRVMILPERHLIYCPTLAERFDLHFKPLVPKQKDGLQVLDFSQPGTLHRYANSGLEFELTSFPEEEEAVEEYFRWYRPQPGDLVYDVGANCGYSTYIFSKLVGNGGRVIAFEPDPLTYSVLVRNIERHALSNIVVVNAAVAGERGRLRFNSEGTLGSSLATVMLRETVGSSVLVDAMTMSDAFEKWGVPAFCKIDIEGAEIGTLAAARDALSGRAVQLAIDTSHAQEDGTITCSGVETILRSYGYEVLSEANPLMTTWARPSASHM